MNAKQRAARRRTDKAEAEAFALLGERAALALGLGAPIGRVAERIRAIDARLNRLRAELDAIELGEAA